MQLRPARPEDAQQIAQLYRISSDGIAEYIWSKLAAPGEDTIAVGTRRYQRKDTNFSYENCTMAMVNGDHAGMLSAFPMHVDPDYTEEDPYLRPYSELEHDNSFYICGMAVFENYRNQGIGTHLLEKATELARDKGYDTLSLICFEQNQDALRLYQKFGYTVSDSRPVVPHPMFHHQGRALLMIKPV